MEDKKMETSDHIKKALSGEAVIYRSNNNLADLLEHGILNVISPINSGAYSPERVEKRCQGHHFSGFGADDTCVNNPDCSAPQNYAPSDANGRAWRNVTTEVKAKGGNVFIICANKTENGADGSCTVTLDGLACRYVAKPK